MTGRLSLLQASLVIARRDFSAILFSRSFFFFLLGPLFPLIIGVVAGSVSNKVESAAARPVLGIAMSASDAKAMIAAGKALESGLGNSAPEMTIIQNVSPGEKIDAAQVLGEQRGNIAAMVTGSPRAPLLTGTEGQINFWRGPVSLIAAQALGNGPQTFPAVALAATASSTASERQGRMRTAQAGQTLLFLLTMMLAGMVLSNLVEEKANKIIEVLAAAVPMDAVFFGKLFAMLAVSFVGIAVWGTVFGGAALISGLSLSIFVTPAVGWPMFIALGVAYFAMAYLLLGSVFLTIGSMASTVREVQTLSMPVTMSQLVVFFFASFAAAQQGSMLAFAAEAFPLSSPFAMLARAAQDGAVMPHVLALVWQAVWVALFVRYGAKLFRRRVMKSGPAVVKVKRGLFARLARDSAKPAAKPAG